ncbi:unnamed protein product [Adineta steineri]|uniref:Uncharacterized protein n=1 Tax=Adineta steineri TaxID=433720 RepID=A0A813P2E2_9BILA|nr:unnamed protein product [Adineta steineri]CAF0747962.1 unnamed protein product [Adineta steineri]
MCQKVPTGENLTSVDEESSDAGSTKGPRNIKTCDVKISHGKTRGCRHHKSQFSDIYPHIPGRWFLKQDSMNFQRNP